MSKPCGRCGGPKPKGKGIRFCDDCTLLCPQHRQLNGVGCNTCKVLRRKLSRASAYKISFAEVDALEAISHCEACGVELVEGNSEGNRRVIDHSHTTGLVRGVLCHNCNTAIGHAMDNPAILRALATFLEDRS